MDNFEGLTADLTAARIWRLLVERALDQARAAERSALALERRALRQADDLSWERAVEGWRVALGATDFAAKLARMVPR